MGPEAPNRPHEIPARNGPEGIDSPDDRRDTAIGYMTMKHALRTVALVANQALGFVHKTTKRANPPLPVGVILAFLGAVLATLNAAHAQAPAAPVLPIVVDDFSDVSKWKVVASDGVEGKVSLAEKITRPDGKSGTALRLDFDFKKGSGYCIARRELDMPVPANFRIGFWMFGGPAGRLSDGTPVGFSNDLEFKLYDQTGDNVWWVREPGRKFRPSWEFLQYHRRQIPFAWGPGGGRVPLERVSAIEFAVTAAAVAPGALNLNRKGYVLFDDVTLETLPPRSPVPLPTTIRVNGEPVGTIPAGQTEARDIAVARKNNAFTISLDFGAPREFGGLLLEWEGDEQVLSVTRTVSPDGINDEPWGEASSVLTTGLSLFPGGGADASRATLVVNGDGRRRLGLKRIALLPLDEGTSANGIARVLAANSPRGWYPRAFLGEQVKWAVLGAPDSEFEALLSGDGQVETAKGGRTIEPFMWAESRLWTWADFEESQSLQDGRLPLPTTRLVCNALGIGVDVEPFPIVQDGVSGVAVRYRVSNLADANRSGRLLLALRSFQALPSWHALNLAGGVSPLDADWWAVAGYRANQQVVRLAPDWLVACGNATGVGIAAIGTHDIISRLAKGSLGDNTHQAVAQYASASMAFDFIVTPGRSQTFWVRSATGSAEPAPLDRSALDRAAEEVTANWRTRLHQITLKLPPRAKELEDSFYAQIGWILVNKDGPAIQPGSRTYDRTWIRDGALTATALLYTGHADEVKEFLDWFRTFQYEDGKVPCCVDERGPDPVPEHDSHGQYIYGVATYHRFTHDDDLLKRHWGNVAAAVGYIEKLRATRMTAEYSDPNAPAETRVKFGLMPESISHEGYSAKPMHSYWDDFFTLRGFTDAVYIAEKLGENEQAAKWATLRDDFQRTLVDSIRLAQKIKSITFVPGCAELGDYDPTSTAAALFPGGQADGPLGDSLRATFDRYIGWFRDRRDGRIEWKDYTPYEMRNASALLMLGHADQSHEVLDWMLSERASIGWREWAEIGYKDKKAGKFVGDMPHTWVGSDYVKAVRNLCVYERERDHALVVGAGLKPQWLQAEGGVTVGGFPTEFGTLSYTASMKNGVIAFDIEAGTVTVPPGGIVVMPMITGKVGTVTINGEAAAEASDRSVTVRSLPAKVRIEAK
jgi:hypothetical protein